MLIILNIVILAMIMILITLVTVIIISINNNVMFSFRGSGLCVWLAVGPVMFTDDVVLF